MPGIRFQLVLGVAAYNLTRGAMNEAATALNIDARELSFPLAQHTTINAYLPAFANVSSGRERKELMADMLEVFAQSKLLRRRKRSSFPHAVWPAPGSFPKRKSALESEGEGTKSDEKVA